MLTTRRGGSAGGKAGATAVTGEATTGFAVELRASLASVTTLTGRLNQTVDVNSENLDEVLDNLRDVTENLKEITDTIKARPYLLIRSSPPPEHKPGDSR